METQYMDTNTFDACSHNRRRYLKEAYADGPMHDWFLSNRGMYCWRFIIGPGGWYEVLFIQPVVCLRKH